MSFELRDYNENYIKPVSWLKARNLQLVAILLFHNFILLELDL